MRSVPFTTGREEAKEFERQLVLGEVSSLRAIEIERH